MCENEQLSYIKALNEKNNAVWDIYINTILLDEAITNYNNYACGPNSSSSQCKQAYGDIMQYYCGTPEDMPIYGRVLPQNLVNVAPNKTVLAKINDIGVLSRKVEELYIVYTNCEELNNV